jgi:hypothetical protein
MGERNLYLKGKGKEDNVCPREFKLKIKFFNSQFSNTSLTCHTLKHNGFRDYIFNFC